MTDRQMNLFVWAVALVIGGVLLLLFNFDVLARYEPTAQYLLASLLGIGGLAALISYFWQRDQWWRLMPGWTLLALAAMVLLSVNEAVARPYIAATLFVGLTLAFTHLYLVNRSEHWWAIIPGGFMLVLAGVISLSVSITRLETLGAVLFVGMGLVFGLVYLLAGKRHHWWALIPGGVLLFLGLLTFAVENTVQNALLQWWPTLLIIVGAVIAFIAASQRSPAPKVSVNVAPSSRYRTSASATSASGTSAGKPPAELGEYSQPAPGASVEELPDPDHR